MGPNVISDLDDGKGGEVEEKNRRQGQEAGAGLTILGLSNREDQKTGTTFTKQPYFNVMYCPSCGSDERQLSQFCRVCGTDLRSVRLTLERPDSVTASAVSARQQISLAVADRIRQVQSGKDLEHIAEEVLPQLEKFLESPEERRLRRVRAGLITAAIGLGASIGTFLLAVTLGRDFLSFIVPAVVLFMIGIGVVINGFWFTVPRKRLPTDELKSLRDESVEFSPRPITKNIEAAYQSPPTPSVTEHTTHHLGTKDVG